MHRLSIIFLDGGNAMDMITSAIVVIPVCCVIAIKIFANDSKHDLEIQAGNFRLSIKNMSKKQFKSQPHDPDWLSSCL